MAVSFPSNPVSGDEHINNGSVYVYDATKGIWNSKATLTTGDVQGFNLQPASATPSDTAPANPDTGDMWYDTANSDLYVYNGNFWVQTNTEAVPVPEDVSDLTDTTGIIPADVSDLTDTTELLGGGVAQLGTLTKTFVLNEASTITLSDSVSPVPNVSVFKEIPQEGFSTKGNWDVAADASNYEILNEAINLYSGVDITPSSATANGTFTLDNSGTPTYISNSDVGKRVIGNGGEATITAADGSYELVTNFNDTNTITAGNWSLQAATGKSDGSGITLSGASTIGNLSTVTQVTGEYTNVSSWLRQPRGMTWQPDGSALYVCDSTDDRVKKFTCTTPFDITTGTYTSNYVTVGSVNIGDFPVDIEFKDDGTKAFILLGSTNDKVVELDLSVAWDLSTVSYVGEYSIQASDDNTFGLAVSPDGTRMMIFGAQYTTVFQFTLSTAWDVTSATASGSFLATAQVSTGFGMDWKRDGTGFILQDLTQGMAYEYSVTTAWDVTTASYAGFSHDMSLTVQQPVGTPSGITYHPQSTSIWVIGYGNKHMNHWDFGGTISYPVSQYFPAVTGIGGQIDTTGWSDINTMTADETLNGGEIYYAVSTDNRTTWKVNLNGSGERSIVRNNSGTWQYNDTAISYGTSENWVDGTTNDEKATLQEALSAQAFNRMNSTQLNAISDPNHFTLGDTLDLMIALYSSSETNIPISDGVTINYDANALVEQAINGTDYKVQFPDNTSVKIISLANQNLKIRIL